MTNQRTVMHIDFDSFFASVEQQANPLLRGKPIGVTGDSPSRGIVCAASKEAKKYGIKTGTPVFKAKEMCPTIILVKGDFTKYQYIHKKSLEVFNQFSDLVEPFSIDEAFIDVTQTMKLRGLTSSVSSPLPAGRSFLAEQNPPKSASGGRRRIKTGGKKQKTAHCAVVVGTHALL